MGMVQLYPCIARTGADRRGLSQVALKEIIGVVLIYGLKALFENLSKNNSWPDKGNSTPPEDGAG